MNPTRAAAQKPIGASQPPEGGPGLYSHLGHFTQPSVLKAGHNTTAKLSMDEIGQRGMTPGLGKKNAASIHPSGAVKYGPEKAHGKASTRGLNPETSRRAHAEKRRRAVHNTRPGS